MDEQRAKIQEDLRGLLAGDVRCDDVFVQMYSSDASIYQIRPLGVVRPRSVEDVVACVQYAHANLLPIHARGAGTGLAGDSLGPGLVLDFSKYMRRVVWTKGDQVRVQPGMVLERLNHHLADQKRSFPPDPATGAITSIGSVINIDGSGSHSLKYGAARQYVKSMQVVLASGDVLELGRESLTSCRQEAPGSPRRELAAELDDLLERNEQLITDYRPRTRFNGSGYQLADVRSEGHLDLAKLLVGSEGTLALVTEATLETLPLAKTSAVALLFFDRLDAASRAALDILELDPSACDLVDRRLLSLARDTDPRYELLIPRNAEAALLVEQEADSSEAVHDRLRRTVDHVRRGSHPPFDHREAFDPVDVELYWKLARKVIPRLYRLKGSDRPLPFVEDMAVPPHELPAFLVTVQNVLKRHQVTASLFAHAGQGQLHIRPFLDLGRDDSVRTMRDLAAELYDQVFEVGGTISGEHGDGLSRTPFVARQYGPLFGVFQEVKRIFDPLNILNPGKIVGTDPDLLIRHLRRVAPAPIVQDDNGDDLPAELANLPSEPQPLQLTTLQLTWTPSELLQTARACNGCGACRSQAPEVRMCPIFRFAPQEEASPRAKGNLMRAVMTGDLSPASMSGDDFKQVADLCVNCKMCRLECPASVDIPKLALEAKASYVATNGLRTTDAIVSRIDTLSTLGSLTAPLANWVIGNRYARWLLEKLTGIAQGRKLPRCAGRPFLRRAARRRLTTPREGDGPKVLYFVDSYANFHDPQLAEAFVAILEHNGVNVYVHPGQKSSGMPLVSLGAVERARDIARQNVSVLVEGIRQGYQVVATEPSAALCLIEEYAHLLDDPEVRLVAEQTSEACAYLWNLHREGKLRTDLAPLPATLVYHQPCHLRALGVGSPGESLLRLIPQLNVLSRERGCSGMAGTYGLKRENYRSSLRAGWDLISSMREAGFDAGTTECSACKMQMEQGTTKPTIHPLKLLALSYGLMPELGKLLFAKSEELVVT